MKIMNVLFAIIMMAVALGVNAEQCKGLADDGVFASPSALADAIEASIASDPSGNGLVRRANITPNGYLQGIQKVKPEVTLGGLSAYLRSLKSGAMPKGEVHLSRACGGKIDTDLGNWRKAKAGEKGWYDPDGTFVMAGMCTNTFLDTITIRIDRGQEMASHEEVRDPFPNQQASAGVCPVGKKFLSVRMMEPAAANHSCAQEHMLPQNGNLGPAPQGQKPGTVWTAQKTWSEDNKFSNVCGPLMYKEVQLGRLDYGTQVYKVKYSVRDAAGNHAFFRGTVQGKVVRGANADYEAMVVDKENGVVLVPYNVGFVVAEFEDVQPRTPTMSGIGGDLSSFSTECLPRIFTGIDAGGSAPAVAANAP